MIEGPARFGTHNEFFSYSVIGGKTQDLKYQGEPTYLEVADGNVFREYCSVHRGTHESTPTRIGSHNLFLAGSHVAHDCQLGDHIILSGGAGLAGHVVVEDYAIVSGMSAVHQFCRVGCHSIIGGLAKVVQDVPPYTIVDGNPASIRGLNSIGLQRRGFPDEVMKALKVAYKKLFLKKEINLAQALSSLKTTEESATPHVAHLIRFIENSDRGISR
jgi:UDP-N-acetylglucosamine acyltransferase